jgi:hypothetical protein
MVWRRRRTIFQVDLDLSRRDLAGRAKPPRPRPAALANAAHGPKGLRWPNSEAKKSLKSLPVCRRRRMTSRELEVAAPVGAGRNSWPARQFEPS